MSVTKVTNDNIVDVSAELVSGTLPALDASAVLNMPTGESITESANDPAIDSDLGLGKLWLNTTNGEMFVCTDATAGNNVWKNIAAGDDHVTPPYSFQGTQSGWVTAGNAADNTFETYSLASNNNAVASGSTLGTVSEGPVISKSKTDMYVMGGYVPGALITDVQKVSFSTAAASSTVNNLSVGKYCGGGASSELRGYQVAGCDGHDHVEYQSHVNDGDSADIGNLYQNEAGYATCMSGPTEVLTDIGWYNLNAVHHFSFANDATKTKHCDMAGNGYAQGGCSSTTHGYTASAHQWQTTVRKVGFASGSTQINHSTLTVTNQHSSAGCGTCSETHGYQNGGYPTNGNSTTHHIESWSFASESGVSHIGNLTQKRAWSVGAQI